MREIRTSGLMSGERETGRLAKPQATAPFLDSTIPLLVLRGEIILPDRRADLSQRRERLALLVERLSGCASKRSRSSERPLHHMRLVLFRDCGERGCLPAALPQHVAGKVVLGAAAA